MLHVQAPNCFRQNAMVNNTLNHKSTWRVFFLQTKILMFLLTNLGEKAGGDNKIEDTFAGWSELDVGDDDG